MDDFSLKSRAIVFALGAGAITFILALFAVSGGVASAESAGRALIVAIICAVLCWASAERTIAATAAAIGQAILRLSDGARGDLASPIPPEVKHSVPPLAEAMDLLFRKLHGNLNDIRRLALYDPVTGLANRTHFRNSAEVLLRQRSADRIDALYFIDLDRFKSVNDRLGHAAGDMLLAMVADRLGVVTRDFSSARGTALIGRLSGDEFTILLSNVRDGNQVEQAGEAILAALTTPFDIAGQAVSIGASIGIALLPDHGTALTDLMRAADAAMYRAKSRGRGRVEYFSQGLEAELLSRMRLESDLRAAVEGHEFELAFQPQVSAVSGDVVAAEALLRWHHPDGVRLAGSFIQRAEDSGLMVEIGDWVIERVAATIARWAEMGIRQRMAVNISAREIDHAGFFRRLRAALHAVDAPASLLELEISESLAMRCSDEVVGAIAALRADGASIAIDNFGTGYSNLGRLRSLPIDRVKLDGSVIEHVATRHEARVIAQALIALIHGLNCQAVAEGIETLEQAEVLRVIGCDLLQGYAIAQPMDETAFLAWTLDERDRAVRA